MWYTSQQKSESWIAFSSLFSLLELKHRTVLFDRCACPFCQDHGDWDFSSWRCEKLHWKDYSVTVDQSLTLLGPEPCLPLRWGCKDEHSVPLVFHHLSVGFIEYSWTFVCPGLCSSHSYSLHECAVSSTVCRGYAENNKKERTLPCGRWHLNLASEVEWKAQWAWHRKSVWRGDWEPRSEYGPEWLAEEFQTNGALFAGWVEIQF